MMYRRPEQHETAEAVERFGENAIGRADAKAPEKITQSSSQLHKFSGRDDE